MAWWDVCNNGTKCTPWNPVAKGDPASAGGQRNDYSIPLPVGTPVTSPVSGIVLDNHTSGGGYYSAYGRQPWGGEVDVLTWLPQYGGLVIVNLLHFDTVRAKPWDRVRAGDVLGTSGGQTSGGTWPSSPQDSSGPHMGIGVHGVASWSDMRNPATLLQSLWAGHNLSSMPQPEQLQAAGLGNLPQGQVIQGSGSIQVNPSTPEQNGTPPDPCGQYLPVDPRKWFCLFQHQFSTLFTWLSDPLRILKLAGGILLIIGGFVLFILPTGLEVAGAATGQPELASAGRALQRPRAGGKSAAVSLARAHRQQRQRRTAVARGGPAARAATGRTPAAKRGARTPAQPETAVS